MPENNTNPALTPEKNLQSDSESWLARNTVPLLAIITVLMMFYMFGYFVCLSNSPSKESADLRKAQHALTRVESKFSEIRSAQTASGAPVRKEEVRKERDRSRKRVSTAMEVADDARDRRGVVKEFIMYILGVLSSALTTILAYYFGSSKGSADKYSAMNAFAAKSQTSSLPAQVSPDQGVADRAKGKLEAAAG
jgi:hypothetical protein